MAEQKTFKERVAQYVQLRDLIRDMDDEHKKKTEPYKAALEQLGGLMLTMLNQSGQDSAKTEAGTVYVIHEVSATVADKSEFRRHVIATEDWDLLDWRANKTAVKSFVSENNNPPPGVNFATVRKVGVRRPGAKEE